MRFFALSLVLAACAANTKAPAVDPYGPHAANETVTAHGGSLQLSEWPQNGVEVRGDKVYVWVFLEGTDATALTEQARAQATEELRKFVEAATQQLDLQLQAAGQAPASSGETDAIRARIAEGIALSGGERAWQNVTREEQSFVRVFMRYAVSFSALAQGIERGLGDRPYKGDIARKVIASFDPDAR